MFGLLREGCAVREPHHGAGVANVGHDGEVGVPVWSCGFASVRRAVVDCKFVGVSFLVYMAVEWAAGFGCGIF